MLLNTMLSGWNEEHAWFEVLGHVVLLVLLFIAKMWHILEKSGRKEEKNSRTELYWCTLSLMNTGMCFVSDAEACHPETYKTEQMLLLRLPNDKSCVWLDKHLSCTTGPEPNTVLSHFYRSALQLLPPLPPHQCMRAKQKAGTRTKWKLSTHKSHINPTEFFKVIDSTESTN